MATANCFATPKTSQNDKSSPLFLPLPFFLSLLHMQRSTHLARKRRRRRRKNSFHPSLGTKITRGRRAISWLLFPPSPPPPIIMHLTHTHTLMLETACRNDTFKSTLLAGRRRTGVYLRFLRVSVCVWRARAMTV